MPVATLPPPILQPILPLRETLGSHWETILIGIAAAPDPTLAAANLSRLAEHGLGSGAVISASDLCAELLFLLGSSQYLTAVLLSQARDWEAAFLADRQSSVKSVETHLLPLRAQLPADLADLAEEDFQHRLRAYRNREYLRIGTRDLLARATLEDTTRDLSYLAEAASQIAYEYARARLRAAYGEAVFEEGGRPRPLGFVVFGMGKVGGEELNFSSDIDLVYLYERDAGPTTGGSKGTTEPRAFFTQLAQHLTRLLSDPLSNGRVFRVDLRLRPDGTNGPVVNSLPNTLLYYESWGQTWERAVWLKARPLAGEKALGEQFLREVSPFVFRRYLDFTTIEDIKEMKARIERSLPGAERGVRNVKLGHGGIREIEFVTQALQLIHAGKDARVHERTTLKALDRLAAGHYLAATDRDTLRDAYYFLRQVEHKLQIVQDRQTHTLPDDEAGIQALARRLRLGESKVQSPKSQVNNPQSAIRNPQSEVEVFWTTLRFHTDAVHQIFLTLFHAPEETPPCDTHDSEIAALLQELHHEERTLWRLQQLGFRNLTESYQHLQLLRDGPPHSPASPRRRKILYGLA
ncbi:MAG: hypothetical protein ACRERD_24690, partial [Candidatus Binatia bacterium]